MSFWSTEKLILKQSKQELIKPFQAQFAKHGAYELSLGSEAFLTTEGTKRNLDSGEQLTIPPGQFGLLLTEEVVTIPNDAIGFISVRFTKKRRGLINVSGFHVDPGFSGPLKFAVYNAGSQKMVLSRGERVFMIWFSDLSEPTADLYEGGSSSPKEITSEDVMSLQGEVASPAELKRRIDGLEREMGLLKALAIGVLVVLVGVWGKACIDNKQSATATQSPSTSNLQTESKEAVQNSSQTETTPAERDGSSAKTPANQPEVKQK